MPLDNIRTVKALLDAVSTKESTHSIDTYNMTELIKALQNDPQTDANDLFRVEWAYVALLNEYSGVEPKLLEKRLSTEPSFYCEVIRLIYRSKNEDAKDLVPDDTTTAIATNAWRLLQEWKRPPGLKEDGSLSPENLNHGLRVLRGNVRNQAITKWP